MEIQFPPDLYLFFYRNAIDTFHAKAISFHVHNDKRNPTSIY